MAMRYPGGFISSTAPTVSANSAKGVWTLEEAMQYIRAGQWPVATGNGDPYFQYNTMLLPGQGTNGAQNNTFLDSSTNNFTITRNGNTTQGTFTPFSGTAGNWSNYFDGTGDYLTLPDSTALNLETGDFTIELWFYVTASSVNCPLIYRFDGDASSRNELQFGIVYNTSGNLVFSAFQSTTNDDIPFTGVSINQWHHCALVRSGNNIYAYLDGVRNPTTRTLVGSLNNGGWQTWIGGYREGGTFSYQNGFISNVRILKGTALYTGSTYTVPTAPLTAIANTTLLTCQNNRFVDNSTNAFTLTVNGNVAVIPFQPFGAPTVAYSASTIGGSGYFDGTGDFLDVSSNAAFGYGTGDFTIEFWIYPTSISGSTPNLIDQRNGTSTSQVVPTIYLNAGVLTLFVNGANRITGSSVSANTWSHIALCRSGASTKLFLNGAQVGSTYSDSNNYVTSSVRVFCSNDGTPVAQAGFCSDLRITKGGALYTAAFTPPTAPSTTTVSSGTVSLLTSFTNAGIIDNAQDNNLETVGGAQISTTQYKWGASSMYFDGTGDYLIGPTNPAFRFGAGDFTIECWVYLNSSKNQGIFDTRNSAGSTSGMAVAINSSNNPYVFLNNTTVLTSSAVLSLSTWTHLAFVKTAGTIAIYVNGNKTGSVASSVSLNDTSLTVASVIDYRDSTSTYKFDGYINDLRVTTGYSRYPYNFTAPTAALPLFWQAAATPSSDPYFDYTTLLLPGNGTNGAQNNTFLDSSTNNFSITRNGNTTQGTFTPFSQTGWSNSLASKGHFTFTGTSAFSLDGDFTLECWVYLNSYVGSSFNELSVFNNRSGTSTGTQIDIGNSVSGNPGNIVLWHNGSTIISAASGTIPVGQWTHFAFVRSGSGSNNFKLYINGVMTSQASSTATFFGSSGTFYIGQTIYDQPFNNTISNFRITKGGALYTSNFIPSTTPLTTTVASGTVSLLTCQSNRFIDNSASPVTLTPVTSPSVQAFSPFNPTAAYSTSTVGGSGYFDGTGDFLSVTNNAAFNFGSAAFTIEFWYYPTTLSGTQCLITNYGGSTTGFVIQMGGSTAGSGRIDAGFSGDGADITSTNAVQLNSWNHIAISGTPGATGIKLFINGAQEGSTYTGATSLDTSSTLLIGEVASTNRLSGYLSGLRLLKGTAQYTTTFTPPTAPLTNITNTSLLLNYTNGGIIDNTAKNNLETVGGASISTTVSKFGGSSMYFDGTGDALYIPDSPNLKFGTGDFTMEAWVYLTATPSAQFATIIGRAEYGSTGDWIFQVTNALKLTIYINTGYTATSTGAISLNTWTHVAAVRYGSSVRLFINGVQDGSGTSSASTENNATGVYTVGSDQAADEAMFTGYINDLRLTKGIARYTQNFTPPTTAFLTL